MKTYKIVKVEWYDAANHRGWNSIDRAKDFDSLYSISAGILVKVNKGCIGVTHSLNEEKDISETIVIPKKTISSIEIVSTFRM